MKAVILAAGYATRLYPLTLDKPKCLLSVGGRTMLDWIFDKLKAVKSLEEVAIVTNAKFHAQLEAWSKKASLKATVRVLNDGTSSNDTRLGAIGDLNFTLDAIGKSDDVLVLASDNLFDVDLSSFVQFAQPKGITLGLYDIKDAKLAANKFGVVELNREQQVAGIEEKPAKPKTSLVATGVYYFPAQSLGRVQEYLSGPDAQDAPGHYLRWLLGRVKIFGFVFSGVWYDIGSLEALEEADKIYRERREKMGAK